MFYPSWTENEIYILKVEWEKGTSGSVIGNIIGKSRNAIIGKAHRMNIMSPNSPKLKIHLKTKRAQIRDYKKERALARENGLAYAMKTSITKKKPPKFYATATPLANTNPIGIMELNKRTCRSIVGEDNTIHKLATYCGNEVFPGQSYCPTHCAIYFKPLESRKRAA